MNRNIFLTLLVLSLSSDLFVLAQEAAKADAQSTVNVAAGQGFTGPNEGVIDEKTGRSPLLDSIFNIPIATLRAVNELVQSIAVSVNSAVPKTTKQQSETISVSNVKQ